ncbi:uncharacterized protein M6D78_011054 [Vipera latastei]
MHHMDGAVCRSSLVVIFGTSRRKPTVKGLLVLLESSPLFQLVFNEWNFPEVNHLDAFVILVEESAGLLCACLLHRAKASKHDAMRDTTKEVQICLRAKKDHLEKFSCVSTENSLKLN